MAGFSDFLSEIVMMTFFIFLAKPGFKCKYLHFFWLIFPVDLQFQSSFRFASLYSNYLFRTVTQMVIGQFIHKIGHSPS